MKKIFTLLTGILFVIALNAQTTNKLTYPLYIGKAGTSTGSITLYGITSGTVQLKVPDIAGTSTIFQLPSSNGTADYVLKTDGTGILSWTAPTNWNTAYTDRLKWDGGSTDLVSATGRTSLGGTTVGQAFFILTNPSAITFPRINADNSVTARSAANFKADLSLENVTNESKATMFTSPALTDTPTAPTAAAGTNTTQIATTAFTYAGLAAQKYFDYDYYIEEVTGTFYARPNPNTSLTAYSGAVVSGVVVNAMSQLTNGGLIQFAAGTFDEADSIRIPYDNITWRGMGKYETALKLKDAFDAGKTISDGFIQVIEKDNFTIIDMEIDGNGANQTKIDIGDSGGDAIICGIETESTQHTTIDNCYIHDFTETGVFSSGCDFLTIKNSHIKDNYWNGVTFGWGTDFNVVENCLVEGGGDVGVALYGRNNKVINSTIRYVTGTNGFDNSQVSISFEFGSIRSQYHQILNNLIKGNGQAAGIVSNAIGEGSLGVVISNNYIDSCGVAISMMGDSSLISNNKIVNPQGETYNYGIFVQDGDYNFITGNDITCRTIGSGDYPILLTNTSDGADYNKVTNNNLFGGTYYSIGVGHANCDGNYIAGNIFNDSNSEATDIYDVGTGTIKTYDNYDYNDARFNPITTGANGIGITGGYAVSMATTGATSVTLPTSGTLATIGNINATRDSIEFGIFNILDYGATNGGTVEDQTAIQAAINAAALHGGTEGAGKVVIPAGQWYITSPDTLKSYITIEISPNAYFTFPDNYNKEMWVNDPDEDLLRCVVSGGNFGLYELSPNWNFIELRENQGKMAYRNIFENINAFNVDTAISLKTMGNGWINANVFDNVYINGQVYGIYTYESAGSAGIDGNIFDNLQLQYSGTYTTGGVYLTGSWNSFTNPIFWDWVSGVPSITLAAGATANMFLGGDIGHYANNIVDNTSGVYSGNNVIYSVGKSWLAMSDSIVVQGAGGSPSPNRITINGNMGAGSPTAPGGGVGIKFNDRSPTNVRTKDINGTARIIQKNSAQMDNGSFLYFQTHKTAADDTETGYVDALMLDPAGNATTSGAINYILDNSVGGNDTYTATTVGTFGYAVGKVITFHPLTSNTGACTLNINGGGAIAIKTQADGDPANSDMVATGYYPLCWDGANWVLMTK